MKCHFECGADATLAISVNNRQTIRLALCDACMEALYSICNQAVTKARQRRKLFLDDLKDVQEED